MAVAAVRVVCLCLLAVALTVYSAPARTQGKFPAPSKIVTPPPSVIADPPWLRCKHRCEVRVSGVCKWDYGKCGGPHPVAPGGGGGGGDGDGGNKELINL